MKHQRILETVVIVTAVCGASSARAVEPGAVAATASPVRTITEFAKIRPSDGYPVAFGASIAVSGNDLVVGAPGYITEEGVVGTAYVFHRVGPKWIETGKLVPNFEQIDGEDFGLSVAIEGDFIVVGAPHIMPDVIGGGGYGRAFIFRRDERGTPDDPLDDEWWEDAELRTPDEIRYGDNFGYSVSIGDGLVLIGRIGDSQTSGSAYLYRRVNGVWSHVASLDPSDTALGDSFGDGVSLSGGVALVGASTRSDYGTHSGAAYVFREADGVWLEQTKLTPSDAASYDHFGGSDFIAGAYAVVGAYDDDDGGASSGSVYAFTDGESPWGNETKLVALDAEPSDHFGQAVSSNGASILVGAPGKNSNHGAAYLFRRTAEHWVEERKLTASDPRAGLVLGASVAVGERHVFAGAQEAVYAYVLSDAATSLLDFSLLQTCFRDEERGLEMECANVDFVPDARIDLGDFNELLATLAGP